jgi:hypothetical protein
VPGEVSLDLPPFPLEPRCGICQLWLTDRPLFERVNQALIDGVPQRDVCALLGWAYTANRIHTLSGHKTKHLSGFITRAREYREQMNAFRDVFRGTNTDPAVLLAFRLYTAADDVLRGIGPEDLARLPLGDRMQFVFQTVQLLTVAQRGEAQNRLSELRLELQRKDLEAREDAIRAKLVAYLRSTLARQPALLAELVGVLSTPSAGAATGRGLPDA